MLYTWIKRTRVSLALLFLVTTFLVFCDIYELFSLSQVGDVVYLQFVPSLLKFIQTPSVATLGFVIVIVLTFLIGRFYCSTICPLGVIQDVVTYLSRRFFSRKKMFFKSKKPLNWLRYSILVLSFVVTLMGFSFILIMIDPYSVAGRFFTYLARPLVIIVNNALAAIWGAEGSYVVYRMEVIWAVLLVLSTTVVFLMTIIYMSFTRGRLYCNTICPVGTLLGLISKVSLFKVRINQLSCSICAKCVSVCKSECINLKSQTVDYSRCVSCFNCLAICPDKAIDFKSIRPINKPVANETIHGRREAIATIAMLAIGTKILAATQQEKSSGGKKLKAIQKKVAVSPPGSKSIARFNAICTGCGLCVSACPSKVLRPAMSEYGLAGFMQPHLDYSVSQCNFECTWCSKVCPTGAILTLTSEEKVTVQMGKAIFVKENCVVFTDETACGACSEHCPTKAVDMVSYKGNLVIPQVNQDICVGCGACEHPCPLPKGFKAIYVEGNSTHQIAQKPVEEKATQKVQEDFPF